jgi:amidase
VTRRTTLTSQETSRNELVFLSATSLAAGIRERRFSAVAMLEAHLERIQQVNPRLNALVELNEVRARERARSADDAQGRGESLGALHGLRVTIKDAFDVTDLKSAVGRLGLASHVASATPSAVKRLENAGAVVSASITGVGVARPEPFRHRRTTRRR